LMKARYLRERYGYDCFADDTGLEVEALSGAPGVYSARYAGEGRDSSANRAKLLQSLHGVCNRKARFRTVIALLLGEREELFEGTVSGRIIDAERGTAGFGYDSLFVPDGYDETFAEMSPELKNTISHRGIAVGKLVSRLLTALSLLLLFATATYSQTGASSWTMYRSYYEASSLEETPERVYVVANGSLYSYGKTDSEVKLYSKVNGLSDTDIGLIRYSTETKTLIIVYTNGNIDLWDSDGIVNIPFLKSSTNVQSKNINDIFLQGNTAYLAGDFGVMAVNMARKEIADTYRLNSVVKSVCIYGDEIIAATQGKLLSARLSDNLVDASVWHERDFNGRSFSLERIFKLLMFNGYLILGESYVGIHYVDSEGRCGTLNNNGMLLNIKASGNELIAIYPDGYDIYTDLVNRPLWASASGLTDVASLKTDGRYWLTCGTGGLSCLRRTNGDAFEPELSGITINSPKRNNNYYMTLHGEKLLITGGSRTTNRSGIPGTLITYSDGVWWNFDETAVNDATSDGTEVTDYLSVAVAPDDAEHYYVATYGEGVVEIRGGECVNIYNETNSALVSAIPGNQHFVRVGSLKYDGRGNLWATNCLSYTSLAVLKPDGQWSALHYPSFENIDRLDKIVITSQGHIWVNAPKEGGYFVLDYGGTVDDTSDDRYIYLTSIRDAQSSTGEYFSSSEYLCMAEDRSGVMWLGTGTGLLRVGSPARALDAPDQLTCSRLVRDDEAYFLSGEAVTALSVDAANQKWIGTATQGVFLINEDGSATLNNFTAENSPLPSNTITGIVVNERTGEVFIGTDKGLVSYKSRTSSSGSSFSDVSVYPNPVRPDYNDRVTISGLQNNAVVKITDIGGHLLSEGRAAGSNYVWNCRGLKGERVATGVYLVLVTSSDGVESVVSKIAVVR